MLGSPALRQRPAPLDDGAAWPIHSRRIKASHEGAAPESAQDESGNMSKRIIQTAILLALLPLTSFQAAAAQERLFKDNDLKKLGQSLADYLEATAEAEDIEKAQADLNDNIAKLEKKIKGRSLLSSPADFGRAYWLSKDFSKSRLKKGKVTEDAYEHKSAAGGKVEYAYLVPKAYNPAKEAYPLILCIPDEGESPANHIKEQWLLDEIHDNAIVLCVSMPESRKKWTEMMIDKEFGGLGNLLIGFRVAQENFSVDFDRIYVAGRGAGVPAAVAVGNYFPYRFAGIIGRSGDLEDIGPENYSNLPTYFAGAGGNATRFQEAAKALGQDNVTIEPGGKEVDIWNWIQAHPRVAYPTELKLVPGNVAGKPYPTRAYWLGVEASEGRADLKGRVDRSKNTIYVDGTGVSGVTLYLNDQIVDLDKPVKVICNGVETEALMQRRLSVTLEFLKKSTSDANCIFVTTQSFSLPTKAAEGGE